MTSFRRGAALHSGRVQVGDYAFRTPQLQPSGLAEAASFTSLTDHVFPSGVETANEAKTQAALRLEMLQAAAVRCAGESTYAQLRAGQRFKLSSGGRASLQGEYVITAVEHRGTPKGYRNSFTCIPSDVPFRPARMTPTPHVTGIVPAIVVGPEGADKHVDQYGRVRVRFSWRSREAASAADTGDAGWVRVLVPASGRGATSLILPDVGDEVAIAFSTETRIAPSCSARCSTRPTCRPPPSPPTSSARCFG